ncbi:MAG: hypothetical protein Q7S78_02245 [Candidatus Azambacteria bacterium]|nr:hypothetical protein [Candidatus Azambacteria bacterium]
MFVGSLLGLLAVTEAALSFGVYFRETLWYDLKLNKNISWVLTGLAPLSLFLFGARDIIPVIDIVGALFFGFQAVVILMIHKKLKNSENVLYYIIGVMVILGAILSL